MQQIIGWGASAVLLVTISTQIYRQWKERSSEGVSRWLFIGQMAASAGFTVYSWMLGDWVFICTNALMFLSAVVGLVIVLRHRSSPARSEEKTES